MRFGSVCSGIEAASVAWEPLGWRAAFFSEIDPFPRAVLAHRFPGVPLHGDFTTIRDGEYGAIDLLVGGTPCQAFSVAGLRRGLADQRGNLALEYLRLADRQRPRWLVWENVPGVLSSNGGRDFGAFLGGLAELGYGFAYRVLDAQHFGLAQRRARVFVVGYLGDWRPAAAVLFEPASLRWHPAPRREAGEGVAGRAEFRAAVSSGHGWWDESDLGATIRAQDSITKADTLVARCITTGEGSRQDYETCTLIADTITRGANQTTGFVGDVIAHTLRADGFDASEDGTGRGTPLVPMCFPWQQGGTQGISVDRDLSGTLVKNKHPAVMAFDLAQITSATNRTRVEHGLPASTLSKQSRMHVASPAVRRLTPRECERLQGFPDDWTLVPYRGKPAADGPRYRALGNSMAVPVMRWIGARIAAVHAQLMDRAA